MQVSSGGPVSPSQPGRHMGSSGHSRTFQLQKGELWMHESVERILREATSKRTANTHILECTNKVESERRCGDERRQRLCNLLQRNKRIVVNRIDMGFVRDEQELATREDRRKPLLYFESFVRCTSG